ncbi:hypothetical protein [Vagococcus hydrophili]|uniref:Uncharacterized protein n=1 Tax=Vagococcus hydrophili TaxID=2714947 RepID=A0A6G8AR49_9ENTE|nr:hypothetical protein [Vagococcus hydrophili]QIL47558.1 hypothetical protein G7082_02905 [Vagococcus hydrophili]
MDKIIEMNTGKSEQTLKDLENKIFDYSLRWEELIKGQIEILKNVTDEGSILFNDKSEVIACVPSEKLGEVIKDLEGIKKEMEMIEAVENFLYE